MGWVSRAFWLIGWFYTFWLNYSDVLKRKEMLGQITKDMRITQKVLGVQINPGKYECLVGDSSLTRGLPTQPTGAISSVGIDKGCPAWAALWVPYGPTWSLFSGLASPDCEQGTCEKGIS